MKRFGHARQREKDHLAVLGMNRRELEANPAPFCVLDEVDAALDESNVRRFTSSLKKLGKKTQFIVITHNRGTIESAGTIYGLSMGDDHATNVLSLRLSDLPDNSEN